VSALSFGAGTFGGRGPLFSAWGDTDAREARRLIDICLDAGVNLFDTADVYSDGASEEVLGAAIKGRRDEVLLSTKTSLPTGDGPNDAGSSRARLITATDAALRRLGTDYIDLLQLHAFDAGTPVEETVSALDDLITAGKIRYAGVSNFSGWQLMKSLAVADRLGARRYVAHQVYYSLVGRDYEWELMPLALDQKVGTVVWSPLGWGRLTGKVRRGQPLPQTSRLQSKAVTDIGPQVDPTPLPPERRATHRIDVARAHNYLAQDDDAIAALLTAEREAPQWVRHSPSALETVRDIHRRTPVSQGGQSSEVMGLAERCRAIQ